MKKATKEAPTNPPAPSNVSNWENIKNVVEVIGKVSLGFLAFSYVVGLIVVNIYLSKFGVYSLSIFRVNYISAGIWLIIPVFLTLFYAFSIFSLLLWSSKKWRDRISDNYLVPVTFTDNRKGLVFGALILLPTLGIIFVWQPVYSLSQNIGFLNAFLTLVYVLIVTFFSILAISYSMERSDFLARLIRCSIIMVVWGCYFALYINLFAHNIYGKIPSYLGGGSPKKAQLILDEEAKIKNQLESLGVVFGDNFITTNVQILSATDSEYILVIESKDVEGRVQLKGLTISKDSIEGILFDEPNFLGGSGSGNP